MNAAVAVVTKRNQILLEILTGVTPELLTVNFKIGHPAARLASPTIPVQHSIAKLFVRLRIEPKRTTFWRTTFTTASQ
jgi:hypothetical protein